MVRRDAWTTHDTLIDNSNATTFGRVADKPPGAVTKCCGITCHRAQKRVCVSRDLYFFTPGGQFRTMVIGSGAFRRGVSARIR
jgi:hypothetical protein